MGTTKYRIVEETRRDGETGSVYIMYRAKKKILGLFWFDIGGERTIEKTKELINRDYHKKALPIDRIIAEYEL